MATNSPINLNMGLSPRMAPSTNPEIFGEFQITYNAIRNLWQYLSEYIAAGGAGAKWGAITGDINTQGDLVTALNARILEAPKNGTVYGRRDGAWYAISTGPSGANWGAIGGNIADQTDLIAMFNTKIEHAPADGSQYVSKDGAWAVLSVPPATVAWGQITGTMSAQTDLNNKFNSLDSQIAAINVSITGINTNLTTLSGRMTAAESDIATLESQMSTAQSNISTLQTQMAGKVGEAPIDGKKYVRRNAAWEEQTASTGGIWLPMVNGEVPPSLMYEEDGSLIAVQVG